MNQTLEMVRPQSVQFDPDLGIEIPPTDYSLQLHVFNDTAECLGVEIPPEKIPPAQSPTQRLLNPSGLDRGLDTLRRVIEGLQRLDDNRPVQPMQTTSSPATEQRPQPPRRLIVTTAPVDLAVARPAKSNQTVYDPDPDLDQRFAKFMQHDEVLLPPKALVEARHRRVPERRLRRIALRAGVACLAAVGVAAAFYEFAAARV